MIVMTAALATVAASLGVESSRGKTKRDMIMPGVPTEAHFLRMGRAKALAFVVRKLREAIAEYDALLEEEIRPFGDLTTFLRGGGQKHVLTTSGIYSFHWDSQTPVRKTINNWEASERTYSTPISLRFFRPYVFDFVQGERQYGVPAGLPIWLGRDPDEAKLVGSLLLPWWVRGTPVQIAGLIRPDGEVGTESDHRVNSVYYCHSFGSPWRPVEDTEIKRRLATSTLRARMRGPAYEGLVLSTAMVPPEIARRYNPEHGRLSREFRNPFDTPMHAGIWFYNLDWKPLPAEPRRGPRVIIGSPTTPDTP